MRNIEPQFVIGGRAKLPGLSSSRLGAHKDLAVLEGDHVSWATLPEKTTMQLRHAAIGDEDYAHFRKGSQDVLAGASELETRLQRAAREILKRGQLYRNFSLAIIHGDLWAPLIHQEIEPRITRITRMQIALKSSKS